MKRTRPLNVDFEMTEHGTPGRPFYALIHHEPVTWFERMARSKCAKKALVTIREIRSTQF